MRRGLGLTSPAAIQQARQPPMKWPGPQKYAASWRLRASRSLTSPVFPASYETRLQDRIAALKSCWTRPWPGTTARLPPTNRPAPTGCWQSRHSILDVAKTQPIADRTAPMAKKKQTHSNSYNNALVAAVLLGQAKLRQTTLLFQRGTDKAVIHQITGHVLRRQPFQKITFALDQGPLQHLHQRLGVAGERIRLKI